MIYLNNAKTTVKKPVYTESDNSSPADIKEKLSRILRCKACEISLTESGTEAMRIALNMTLSQGDHLITTHLEHPNIKNLLEELKIEGVEISYVPVNAYGTMDYDKIEALIKDNTKAIVVSHGSYVTGNVSDIERITAIARRNSILSIIDGCQTVGNIEINLKALNPDIYCFSGHKGLMGPVGIGGLYCKNSLGSDFDKSISDETKLARFDSALEFILDRGTYGIAMVPHRLAKRFFESVTGMDHVDVYGDFGTGDRLPIVAINVKSMTSVQLKQRLLKDYDIVTEVVHGEENSRSYVRVSFGYFNTRRDVNDIVWALMEITGQMDFYLLS